MRPKAPDHIIMDRTVPGWVNTINPRDVTITLGPGNKIRFQLKDQRTVYQTTIGACVYVAIRQFVVANHNRKIEARMMKKGQFDRSSVR